MAVFTPFTIPGDTVTVAIHHRKKKFAQAELLSVDTPSPDRVEPECPLFTRCGGCAYQMMAYPAQLTAKARQVEQTLRRVGRLAEVPMRPTLPSPRPYGYRNRIRVHALGGVIGFYAHGADALVDVAHCPIASPEVNDRLAAFRAKPRPDGDYTIAQAGNPRFFEQTNPEVGRALLAEVEALLTPGGRLVDAYCGAGFFSRHLRERYDLVTGIEENEFAVAHARSQASPRERYYAGPVEEYLPTVLAEPGLPPAVILDPPAAGVSPRVLDTLLAARPREILYVSCNPATLARDLQVLCRSYRLSSVTPLDMFAQTAEIEVIAHLLPA